jgi:hypothetical protein
VEVVDGGCLVVSWLQATVNREIINKMAQDFSFIGFLSSNLNQQPDNIKFNGGD